MTTLLWEEFMIETPHFRIGAKRWGSSSGLPVLGLHGWLDNAATFDRLAPLLPAINLVSMDFRGHGLSDHHPPGVPYYYIEMVTDVLQVLDTLRWEKCALLGHSMGAGVASMLAGTVPSRISKMVLIEGIGPLSDPPDAAPEQLWKSYQQVNALHQHKPPKVLSFDQAIELRMKAGGLSREAVLPLVERGTQKTEGGYLWRSDARLKAASRIRLMEEQVLGFLKKIEAPVLLFAAESSFFRNMPTMETRCDHVKNLTLHRVDSNHHLHLETPESIAGIIQNFLND